MTDVTPSSVQYGSGFRYAVAFALNANNRIAGASASTPYSGLAVNGGKTFTLTIPKQRRINHIDADRVAAADFLPPTEAASAVINASADDLLLSALLTNNKEVTIGEAVTIADLSSNQGFEPFISLLLWQQAIDKVTAQRSWRSFMIPRAKAIPIPGGYADREVDGQYDVLITPSLTNIFGCSLTSLTDGATDAQMFRAMTIGKPAIAAWQGDGYTKAFTFPTSNPNQSPARNANCIAVYKNGTLQSAGIAYTTTGFSFTVAPLLGDDIDAFWEY